MRRERPSSSTPKTEAVATKASTIMAKTSKVNILKRKPQDYVRDGKSTTDGLILSDKKFWLCSSCLNNNFDTRTVCNRCQREKGPAQRPCSSNAYL